jgi:NADH-ubiquinone oxidoreductase chain 3
MSSKTLFFLFIPFLSIVLLLLNLTLATHNPYGEKKSPFECGFSSFLFQNRTQFNVSFFIFALLFLLFDLEILLMYPYSVSIYVNSIYGLFIMLIFFILLTIGFIFELGKNALTISSRQYTSNIKVYNADVIFSVTTLSSSLDITTAHLELSNFLNFLDHETLRLRSHKSNYESLSKKSDLKLFRDIWGNLALYRPSPSAINMFRVEAFKEAVDVHKPKFCAIDALFKTHRSEIIQLLGKGHRLETGLITPCSECSLKLNECVFLYEKFSGDYIETVTQLPWYLDLVSIAPEGVPDPNEPGHKIIVKSVLAKYFNRDI